MELLKDISFQEISFEIFKEGITESDNFLFLSMRVFNHSKTKKNVEAFMYYHSVKKGVLDVYTDPFGLGCGGCLLPAGSFVDAVLTCEELMETTEGDRLEITLKIDNKKYPSFLVTKQLDDWYVFENNPIGSKHKDLSSKSINKEIKKKIENFEFIEEQFGLNLQKFSVRVVDEYSLNLFCEVVALNGEVPQEGFNIEVAIYDADDEIVYQDCIKKFDGDFKGFEVYNFGNITLDIPIEEISKIRIYPTR